MRLARSFGLSDPGRRRRRNEDAYVVSPPLFAVADGMGGAPAGKLASRIAAEAMAGEADLGTLIQEANRLVHARSSEDAAAAGMGTTMTAALVGDDGTVTIGHVGDSRAYLVREGRLEQLTEDHSLVAELVRTGQLSAEEAEHHPQRSVITRALGTDPQVEVDTFTVNAQAGDLFLLCSDGLTDMVGDEEILRTIDGSREDLERAARELVRRANGSGGEDNITVVFFELRGDEEPAHAEDEAEDEADTLSELDRVPVLAGPQQGGQTPGLQHTVLRPSVQDELDDTARRVLAIVAAVALLAVGIAVLLLGLR